MARPDVQIKAGIERRLALNRGVRKTLVSVAKSILASARTNAAEHADSGDYAASLDIERRDIDEHVVSRDPAALAIEYGHTTPDGKPVAGQHPLTRAAADAVTRR